jgi:hypothetical protein
LTLYIGSELVNHFFYKWRKTAWIPGWEPHGPELENPNVASAVPHTAMSNQGRAARKRHGDASREHQSGERDGQQYESYKPLYCSNRLPKYGLFANDIRFKR